VKQKAQNKLLMKTPIGNLLFGANVNEAIITTCELPPSLPDGMAIDGSFIVLFRYSPSTNEKYLDFFCQWENLEEEGFSASGEALCAWEWEKKQTLVMIGTEDEDWLSQRLPIKKEENYFVEMKENCLTIKIEDTPKNTELTLHFVVAWSSIPEKTENSCWFAVDVPHVKILRECKKT